MKREFLANLDIGEGAHLSDAAIDAIMAEHGRDITTNQNTIQTLTTERDGLKTQLAEANKTIKSYTDMDIDGIKRSVTDWETKYNKDTKDLKDQLDAATYGFGVERAVANIKFTSEGAKKSFMADLKAKKLQLQDGKLMGLDDFVKTYKESDPGAFAKDDPDPDPAPAGKPKPQFTNPNPTPNGGGAPANPFSFGFNAVRSTGNNNTK